MFDVKFNTYMLYHTVHGRAKIIKCFNNDSLRQQVSEYLNRCIKDYHYDSPDEVPLEIYAIGSPISFQTMVLASDIKFPQLEPSGTR